MHKIFAYSYYGGQDLYYGVPNLEGAAVVNVNTFKDDQRRYNTELTFKMKDGRECQITIRQGD